MAKHTQAGTHQKRGAMNGNKLFAAVGSFLALVLTSPCTADTPTAEIRVKNSSNQMVSLWWINPDNLQYVSQSDAPGIYPQSYVNINSFHTHRFAIVEETGDCTARSRSVSEDEDDAASDDGASSLVDPLSKRRYCNEGRFVVTSATNQLFKAIGEGGTFKVVMESEETKRAADVQAIIDDCVKEDGAGAEGEGEAPHHGTSDKSCSAVLGGDLQYQKQPI